MTYKYYNFYSHLISSYKLSGAIKPQLTLYKYYNLYSQAEWCLNNLNLHCINITTVIPIWCRCLKMKTLKPDGILWFQYKKEFQHCYYIHSWFASTCHYKTLPFNHFLQLIQDKKKYINLTKNIMTSNYNLWAKAEWPLLVILPPL